MSTQFADRIADAVRDYAELVLTGPSTAKDELMTQLTERHHAVAARVTLKETLERATDPQLAAEARKLFERADRMHGIHVAPPRS
jgi:stalled ribosome rescue protein Dom34